MSDIIRILSVKLHNLKNVGRGTVNMPDYAEGGIYNEGSEILGIYGQNGSGKTAVIEALEFMKDLAASKPLPKDAMNYIQGNFDTALIEILFFMFTDREYIVKYAYTIGRDIRINERGEREEVPVVVQEKLSYSVGLDSPLTLLIDARADAKTPFLPAAGVDEATGADPDKVIDITVIKRVAAKEFKSFIFSNDMAPFWYKACEKNVMWGLIPILKDYITKNVFVINQGHSGIISLDFAMPFSITGETERIDMGQVYVSLSEPSVMEKEKFSTFEGIINTVNDVAGTLIPGMKLFVKQYGPQTTKDGKDGIRFELLSSRGGVNFPLRYESEGIKKIVSMLNILALMYNEPSVFVAIDELDAGVFEYLLGELLKVIDETGRGQLLFTSHNLRPLEMLGERSIIFTTANPDKRYVRINETDENLNLREHYIRAIKLGGEEEKLYSGTVKSDIRRALFRAGDDKK
ncbi:MAG: ATP-binding protein [Firmicutes bacterium]|nr:ATP-binding protein [Bacillota bacterium]